MCVYINRFYVNAKLIMKSIRCSMQIRRVSTIDKKVIETIPEGLHKHLFCSQVPSSSGVSEAIEKLQLPKLRSRSIQEHFRIISEAEVKDYQKLLTDGSLYFKESHELPEKWSFSCGWTRYDFITKQTKKEPFPEEDVFVFDVETCVSMGQLPTLAVAVSDKAWYSWCSPLLVDGGDYPKFPTADLLIPLGGADRPRIAIGHNIGYDRARSQEPYAKQRKAIRFMDTMSMFIPMYGMADHQRTMFETNDVTASVMGDSIGWRDAWKSRVSKNSLADVYKFFFKKSLSKGEQKFFVKASMDEIRERFQDLMTYCALDTVATGKVFTKLWPLFTDRLPHPATLFGFLNIGNAYLPINNYWPMFYEKNENSCEEKKLASAKALVTAARELTDKGNFVNGACTDPWMFNFDWNVKRKAQYPEWFYKLFQSRSGVNKSLEDICSEDLVLKSSAIPALFGLVYGPYPLMKITGYGWGYLVPQKSTKKSKLNKGELDVPVPVREITKIVNANKEEFGDIPLTGTPVLDLGGVQFYKIEHPLGQGNVGEIMSKNFFADFEQKVIRPTRYVEQFDKVFESTKATRFWTNYRERYHSEVAIWDQDSNPNDEVSRTGSIAPAIIPAGTVSRRSVHKLWVTLTNTSSDVTLGTGIKSMVQAPEGFKLVGADVDSQEQWLAGLFGDGSAAKVLPEQDRKPGLTPFSKMMLVGQKSDATDLHSVVAKELGIKRDDAKMLNYARLYGSGVKHACQALVRRGIDESKADKISRDLFDLTKGVALPCRKIRSEVIPLWNQFLEQGQEVQYTTVDGEIFVPDYDKDTKKTAINFEKWILQRIHETKPSINEEAVICLLYEDYLSLQTLYFGGYESATFNFLVKQGKRRDLRTPVLGCLLVDSLAQLPEGTDDADKFDSRYKRSVMNWLVQSSAVDFLHLLTVCVEWLCKEYDIPARFVISIHDEVRYLCPDEDAPRLALALMLANMYVRAFISDKVGIPQLPMTVAFFSQVDCDTVLRKEVNHPCVNPDGTTVANGEAWTFEDLIKLTQGSLNRH